MIFITIGLLVFVLTFIFCTLKISSNISREEEKRRNKK